MLKISVEFMDLVERGWTMVDFSGTQSDLLQFAQTLGRPIPSRRGSQLVDSLKPVVPTEANPRSMSARFGVGAFPFHTDAAYIRLPPRYMILRLAEGKENLRPTLILSIEALNLSASDLRLLKREVWLVNGGHGRFLSPLVNDTLVPGTTVLRFDPCCMRPATEGFGTSQQIIEQAIRDASPINVDWVRDRLLVLDNWRVLHARADQPQEQDANRVLERVLISID